MKRTRTFIASFLALLSVGSGLVPVGAAPAKVPPKPNVVDPRGDANYIYVADQATPVNRPEADVLAAWFTSDGKSLSAHWHVAASPVGKDVAFTIAAQPNPEYVPPETRLTTSRCFIFTAVFPAATDPYEPYSRAGKRCTDSILDLPSVPKWRVLADGSVVISTTYAFRRDFPLQSGDLLQAPYARSGEFTVFPTGGYEAVPRIDWTAVGRDYRIR